MNEKIVFDDIVKDLGIDKLDDVFVDPYIEAIFDKVRAVNSQLLEESPSDEELEAIVDTLNEEWSPLIGMEFTVSGEMTFPKLQLYEDEENLEQLETKHYHGQPVYSDGFVVQHIDVAVDDETFESSICKINLAVRRSVDEDEESNDSVVGYRGTADIDVITVSLEQMSPERAAAWADYFHTDFKQQIDVRISPTDQDECAALLAIQDLSETIADDEATRSSKIALDVYLNSIIDLDEEAPYSVVIAGEFYLVNEAGQLAPVGIEACEFLVDIEHLAMENLLGDDVYQPVMIAKMVGPHRDEISDRYLIPIDSLQEIVSIRKRYYDTSVADDSESS